RGDPGEGLTRICTDDTDQNGSKRIKTDQNGFNAMGAFVCFHRLIRLDLVFSVLFICVICAISGKFFVTYLVT
ncbi:MAG: hypothetical protein ABSA39_16620, partial [Edaphobacter sp.]